MPNVPSSLQIGDRSAVSVTLSWTPPSTTHTGFRICYGDNQNRDVGMDVTSATIDLLDPDTSYTFEVKTLSGTEESNPDTCPDNNQRAAVTASTGKLPEGECSPYKRPYKDMRPTWVAKSACECVDFSKFSQI